MNAVTVRVLYSCVPCGLSKVACEVPERGPYEDVSDWVGRTLPAAIKADHSRRSPACQAATISEVLIPMTGVERVGDALRH
jgi:hypothetical protein